MRIIFEVSDLKYATLATVSRCGMVWFSEEVVTIEMLFENYLKRLNNISLEKDTGGLSSFTALLDSAAATNAAPSQQGGAVLEKSSRVFELQRQCSQVNFVIA